MRLFLDTANLAEVESAAATGVLDGVTTNPTLIAREHIAHRSIIERIGELVTGDISVEVMAADVDGMLREAHEFVSWTQNAVIKLPTTPQGVAACKRLSAEGIRTNLTLCFSAAQALLVAKAGATYCSPFLGRLDDIAEDGMRLVREVVEIYRIQNLSTVVLAASIRSPFQAVLCARAGAGACTMPPKVFHGMFEHPLTAAGLALFASAEQATLL